ncbi:hypothetical protein RDWZM_007198 [Blomia tropicalis]|uniref:OTU domain-containing protein n=1 Tax=Blomia tropicalis TaxID=40697 RepID=A0A9Q0M8N6_BLOTA|nr:hypothetical protein RDWZM_007198 [Blomia tropicalis]
MQQEGYDGEDEMLERHRKEKKDLTAKITKLRHSVPKNDKKKKKEITMEIENLESEMKARHQRELNESRLPAPLSSPSSSSNSIESKQPDSTVSLSNTPNMCLSGSNDTYNQVFKVTKSHRRRENKERKERERQERIKLGQLDDSENIRLIEMKRVEELLEERGLNLCEISSDGDCMYKAIEHQMKLTRNIAHTVEELRHRSSEYIRQNKDDFLPFLLNDENNVVTDREFDVYCDKIANTKTWGGHLELKALSNCLKVPIEIIQAEGSSIQIGFSEFGFNNPLILCYFRHAYQLGEHYNSVMPNRDVADEEEWRDNSE